MVFLGMNEVFNKLCFGNRLLISIKGKNKNQIKPPSHTVSKIHLRQIKYSKH